MFTIILNSNFNIILQLYWKNCEYNEHKLSYDTIVYLSWAALLSSSKNNGFNNNSLPILKVGAILLYYKLNNCVMPPKRLNKT